MGYRRHPRWGIASAGLTFVPADLGECLVANIPNSEVRSAGQVFDKMLAAGHIEQDGEQAPHRLPAQSISRSCAMWQYQGTFDASYR